MTPDEQIISLLTEIRDLLKAAPAARPSAGKTEVSGIAPPADAEWAKFAWPSYTNKNGKRRAVTLGESAVAGDYGIKDIRWWAEHYEPKEYKGSISQKDLDFRAALTAATTWLDAPQPNSSGTPPVAAPKRTPPTEQQLANQTGGSALDDDVPF
jgi:hypothetical protein